VREEIAETYPRFAARIADTAPSRPPSPGLAKHAFLEVAVHRLVAQPDPEQRAIEIIACDRLAARLAVHHHARPGLGQEVEQDGIAGLRFAIIVGWNGILLSEWFSGQAGVGFRTRYWFDANRYRGFVGWVIVFIVFIVVLDRLVLNRLQSRAFRWRDPVESEIDLSAQEQVGM